MKRLLQLCSITFFSVSLLNGQQPDKNSWYETPVALIEDIYRAVSVKDSGTVDWERVRSMFIDEAVVVL